MHPITEGWIGVCVPTPLGQIWLAVTKGGLVAVQLGVDRGCFLENLIKGPRIEYLEDDQMTARYTRQVSDNFAGNLRTFSLEIDWRRMKPFQLSVLQQTQMIPFGETTTYKALAEQIGRPNAARAVGRAQATNPFPLIIPCHRVIGSDGDLRGYAGPGRIKTKAWLFKFERCFANQNQTLA